MKIPFAFILTATIVSGLFGQGFETVPPILLAKATGSIDTSVSMILTPEGRLEIIDAYQPWPPRWFIEFNVPDSPSGHPRRVKPYTENASLQNGFVTFFNKSTADNSGDTGTVKNGYIICNKRMEPLDTFVTKGREFNFHDFRINEKGEKLVCYILDTSLNLSGLTGNPEDTNLAARVDVVEIIDSSGKIVFRWNPIKALGVNSLYFRYGHLASRTSKAGHIDWSHANAFSWDFDGNILYCFRHIGIGKVSRQDGHVIWRIDRGKMPYINGKDTIDFYLQHGFEKVSDSLRYNTYSLYSNGDSANPYSFGLEFTVDKGNNAMHIVNKKIPTKKITSGAGGNYSIMSDGDYILNYGTSAVKDTGNETVFFEYGNERNGLYAEYKPARKGKSYRVNELNGWRPPRPRIVHSGAKLTAEGEMKKWVWYQLSGPNNTEVKKVGGGNNFSPQEEGYYCAAGKYGIGYAVSLPFHFKP